jgi:hypothetical protein
MSFVNIGHEIAALPYHGASPRQVRRVSMRQGCTYELADMSNHCQMLMTLVLKSFT